MFSAVDHVAHQEPMTIGSPSSPGGAQYLPGYLLGDVPSPMPQSPATGSRLWSMSSGSPPKGSSLLQRSGSWASPPSQSSSSAAFGQTPRSEGRSRDMLGNRARDKSGAPPIQGLLGGGLSNSSVASPHTTRPQLDQSYGAWSANTSTSFNVTVPDGASMTGVHSITSPGNQSYSQSRKTPPSPAQVDPFYTQGESITPYDVLDETWVTVFGFSSGAASYILQQFSQYGNILKHVVSNDGNWMHLHYQSKIQAKKALSKNGKLFGNIMVGVSPCIDKSVMESDKDQNTSSLSMPVHTPTLSHNSSISAKHTPIRPLTAAYQAASTEHQVIQGSNTPRKSSSVISKAMEYMFGW